MLFIGLVLAIRVFQVSGLDLSSNTIVGRHFHIASLTLSISGDNSLILVIIVLLGLSFVASLVEDRQHLSGCNYIKETRRLC